MMPHGPRDPKSRALIVALVLLAAVVLRGVFFLRFDESYFDSDQAIVGLMAKHLLEGRAFPLFFYGQEYMLGVESWVMAPVFAVFGPSVFALRLTMVLLNAVTTLTLWWLLVRDARLHPWLAALAAAPFALAPFITAAHLVEAQGGNVEPFLWVLVAWLLRDKPLGLGAAMAIAFLHREFSLYALPALLLLQLAEARGRLAPLIRPWALTAFAFVAVFQGVNALKPHADLMGPASAGVPVSPGSTDQGNVTQLLARANVKADALPTRFRALVTEYLPMIVGLQGFRPNFLSIGSDAHVGWQELLPVAAGLAGILLIWWSIDLARRRSLAGLSFPLYLVIVGLEAGVAYALTRDLSMFTFRYGLLALFLPIGFAALVMQASRPTALRATGAALFGLLTAAALVDHVTVLQRASFAPPPPRFVPLAQKLEERGVHLARAGYWRSYVVTFLTQERVIVASNEIQRIREYQLMADGASDGVVTIQETPCENQRPFDVVGPWHLCQ
ncbi:MAG TPA: hypothetical protein VM820_02320 [Vicinamibacterales bacterium]|nr:hypothetical protein [Vicinamibacterales bacterium]